MKEYYVQFSNGDFEFIEARKDSCAYNKATKLAKSYDTCITYLSETFEDIEEDRVIFDKSNGVY